MAELTSVVVAGLVYGSILATAGVGFTLQFGVTNYFNLAYGELMTFGAMVTASLNTGSIGWGIWPASAVGVSATVLLALFQNRFIFTPLLNRRKSIFVTLLATFAVAIMLDNIFILVWGTSFTQYTYSPGAGIHLFGAAISIAEIVYFLIAVGCMAAIHQLLTRTKAGRSMRAMSDNTTLASIAGLNTKRITAVTWAITGFMGGIAGVLFALQTHTFGVSLGVNYEYYVFVAVILGGIGQPFGALMGGLLIGLITQLAALAIPSGLSPVIAFAVLILVMLFRPQGLLGVPGRLNRLGL